MEANAVSSYLAAASWCEITGYDGAASFFYAQAEEEHQHMLKFVHFLNDQGVGAVIPATKQPPKTFKSIESICKTALKNEQGVTKAINKMVDIAQKDKDHNTFTFLQFFVNEQIEEEQQFETILQKLVRPRKVDYGNSESARFTTIPPRFIRFLLVFTR